MAAILTIAQQQLIKPISRNWAKATKETGGIDNYTQLEQEIEENKLRSLLGNTLLQDLQDNPELAANVILLDGGSFEDCDGNNVNFKGIRYVLAYMIFVDYIAESDVSDTYTGMVQKNRNESEPLSNGKIKTLQNKFEAIALTQWQLCEAFLNNNSDDYPYWNCNISKQPYTPKLIGIRKTLKNHR